MREKMGKYRLPYSCLGWLEANAIWWKRCWKGGDLDWAFVFGVFGVFWEFIFRELIFWLFWLRFFYLALAPDNLRYMSGIV